MKNSIKNVCNTSISLLRIHNAISQHHIFHVLVSSSTIQFYKLILFRKNKSDQITVVIIN